MARPAYTVVEDPMSLYSVVHKERKRNSAALIQDTSDSPCSIEQHMNYEDTESEYASELRRQTYLQKIGKFSIEESINAQWGNINQKSPLLESV